MEIECVKYKEKMDSEGACCRHPEDYCKYRTSCIIHFLGKEKVSELKENRIPSEKKRQAKEAAENDRA